MKYGTVIFYSKKQMLNSFLSSLYTFSKYFCTVHRFTVLLITALHDRTLTVNNTVLPPSMPECINRNNNTMEI